MKLRKPHIALFAVLLMMVNSLAFAQSPIVIDENAAASIPGVRVKTELLLDGTVTPTTFSSEDDPANNLPDGYERPLYQQVDPCRMISTRNGDGLVEPYGPRPAVGNGGPIAQHQAFNSNEVRTYQVTGLLPDTGLSTSSNPCSNFVPAEAIGLALRIGVHNPSSDGRILLFPGNPGGSFPEPSRPALAFGGRPNQAASFQEDIATLIGKGSLLLPDTGTLSIKAAFSGNQRLDITVDLLGYFVADVSEGVPGPAGADGQDGTGISSVFAITGIPGSDAIAAFDAATETLTLTIPAGEKGETGPQGPAGTEGPQGIPGETGPEGPQGPQGIQGEIGPEGPQGPQGVQGEIGPEGPQDALGGGQYNIRVDQGGAIVRAQLSGRMRRHHIRVLPGDRVRVAVSPYDLSHGLIVYRGK